MNVVFLIFFVPYFRYVADAYVVTKNLRPLDHNYLNSTKLCGQMVTTRKHNLLTHPDYCISNISKSFIR